MFETGPGATKIKKLDLIDTGYWTAGDFTVKVIFAGKLYLDNANMPNFVNIFTLMFHNADHEAPTKLVFDEDTLTDVIYRYDISNEEDWKEVFVNQEARFAAGLPVKEKA